MNHTMVLWSFKLNHRFTTYNYFQLKKLTFSVIDENRMGIIVAGFFFMPLP